MKRLWLGLVLTLACTNVYGHALSEIMEKVLPTVTYIEVERFANRNVIDTKTNTLVRKRITQPPVIGSGVLIRSNLILTNYHVIESGLERPDTRIWIYFYTSDADQEPRYLAKVVGFDPVVDIAVLQIEGEHASAEICGKCSLPIGSDVFSISNFFGIKFSVTKGIVSATNRPDSRFPYVVQVQLQLLEGSGSSGGPVFNENGQVVAINRTVLQMNSADNNSPRQILSFISFAIRGDLIFDTVERILKQKNGIIIRPDLGVRLVSFNKVSTYYYNTNDGDNLHEGLLVINRDYNQISNTLMLGDIIVSVDGRHFTNPSLFLLYLDQHHNVGDNITLRVWRNNTELVDVRVYLQPARRIQYGPN